MGSLQLKRVASGILVFCFTTGCAGLALRSSAPLLQQMTRSFFEECDAELAREALPAQIKLLEGLVSEAPPSTSLLTALGMAFTGYAMLFVEDEDPERASRFYARAAHYGFASIGLEVVLPSTPPPALAALPRSAFSVVKTGEPPLFWATLSWFGWLALNRDDPRALAQLPLADSYLAHFLENNPGCFYGTPYLLAARREAAKPRLLGGDLSAARKLYEKGLSVAKGRFFLIPYHYARDYAVKAQDQPLFVDLLEGILEGSPESLPEVCLINTVVKKKARRLLERKEDLFL